MALDDLAGRLGGEPAVGRGLVGVELAEGLIAGVAVHKSKVAAGSVPGDGPGVIFVSAGVVGCDGRNKRRRSPRPKDRMKK
jgi:hypothetical protein